MYRYKPPFSKGDKRMANEIICEKNFIKDIFKRWYRVPEYQRPYVWEIEQVETLLEDTIAAFRSNAESQYFLGSTVLKINEKSSDNLTYEEYDLLDGQQRLTTIFLMLAVIRDISENKNIYDLSRSAIFQEENDFDNQPERLRIVFDIRDDVKNFVDEYVKLDDGTKKLDDLKTCASNNHEDISVRNMASAIITCQKFLQELKQSCEFESYFKFFWNKILLVCVATKKFDDAFQLFTVLNDRGLKLRNSDILKATNLHEIKNDEDRKIYAGAWEEMEKYFGDDFDKFLSYVRTILVKRKADMTLLKEFEENIYSGKFYDRATKQYLNRAPLLKKGKDTFKYIGNAFDIYRKVFELRDFNGSFEAANYLTLMTVGLEADYWTAAVLSFCQKFGFDTIAAYDNFCRFLRLLDKKVSADWIRSQTPTTRIENVNAVIKAIEATDTSDKLLSSLTFDIKLSDLEPILRADIYKKRYSKYLMLKLDLLYHGNSTQFQIPPTVSIEHILPQNPPPNSQWRKDFSDAEREDWTDKLGNLILISRRKNSSLSNRDFVEKKKRYFANNIELFSNSVRVLNSYDTWTFADLKQNHADVVKKLLEAYR